MPMSQHLTTWHGLIGGISGGLNFAHMLFAASFLFPGFLKTALSRSTRLSVHRLTARLIVVLYGASILIGLYKVQLPPSDPAGLVGFVLVLSTAYKTLRTI